MHVAELRSRPATRFISVVLQGAQRRAAAATRRLVGGWGGGGGNRPGAASGERKRGRFFSAAKNLEGKLERGAWQGAR
jgi:hypothetical protein